jgi:hypothetical protein
MVKPLTLIYPEWKALFLKKILGNSLRDANKEALEKYGKPSFFSSLCGKTYRKKLYNLWNRLDVRKPMGAFADFARKEGEDGHDEFDSI